MKIRKEVVFRVEFNPQEYTTKSGMILSDQILVNIAIDTICGNTQKSYTMDIERFEVLKHG